MGPKLIYYFLVLELIWKQIIIICGRNQDNLPCSFAFTWPCQTFIHRDSTSRWNMIAALPDMKFPLPPLTWNLIRNPFPPSRSFYSSLLPKTWLMTGRRFASASSGWIVLSSQTEKLREEEEIWFMHAWTERECKYKDRERSKSCWRKQEHKLYLSLQVITGGSYYAMIHINQVVGLFVSIFNYKLAYSAKQKQYRGMHSHFFKQN